jgi:F0F1-type ATP synthase assembly protein I
MKSYKIDKNYNISYDKNKREKKDSDSNLSLAKYLNLGYYLVTPLLIGVFFGLYIDNKLNSKGKLVLIFIIIGTIATFYNLYKLTKSK